MQAIAKQMPIVWTPEYSVGDDEMDRQHQRWFEILNDLAWALKTGAAEEATARAMDSVLGYTRRHFADEEKLMARIGYPDLAAHRLQHCQFVDTLTQYAGPSRTETSPWEFAQLLRGWLRTHIRVVDRRYAEFIRERGQVDSLPEPRP